MHSPGELGGYALLGVLSALAAHGFMRVLALGEAWLRDSRLPQPWRAALGGLLAGGLVAALPEVAGNGYEPLNQILDGRHTIGFVVALLLVKPLATTASVSSGSPGGVFTPTLLIGCCVGFLYGEGLARIFGAGVGPTGGYALVGLSAMLAATTHAPLLAAVMAFELSGDYTIVLPLVLATAVATAVSQALGRDSIYTAELRQRGVGWELTLEGRRVVEERGAL